MIAWGGGGGCGAGEDVRKPPPTPPLNPHSLTFRGAIGVAVDEGEGEGGVGVGNVEVGGQYSEQTGDSLEGT